MNTPATLLAIPASCRTPADALAPALRAIKAGSAARLVFLRYPEARSVAERLAWLFTDRIPYVVDKVPLLHLCLRDAFHWLTALHTQIPDATRDEALTAFFAGLFKLTPSVAEIEIRARQGRWDPLADPPLAEWLRVHRGATCRIVEPDIDNPNLAPRALRAGLISRLIEGPELLALRGRLDSIIDPGT
jgi:hypothetical protein